MCSGDLLSGLVGSCDFFVNDELRNKALFRQRLPYHADQDVYTFFLKYSLVVHRSFSTHELSILYDDHV